jgi:hypothetical protein
VLASSGRFINVERPRCRHREEPLAELSGKGCTVGPWRELGRPKLWGRRALRAGRAGAAVAALATAGLVVASPAAASPVHLGTGAGVPVSTTSPRASSPVVTPVPMTVRSVASSARSVVSSAATSSRAPSSGRGTAEPALKLPSSSTETSPKARKVKSQNAQVVIEPPSAVFSLLSSLGSDELQLRAARTYAQAQLYERRAARREALAAASADRLALALVAARANEARALAAEAAARSSVHFYETALDELGIAEYTGMAALEGTDLASQERQIEFAQLSEVAARTGGAGLTTARHHLAAATERVTAAKARVKVVGRAKAKADATLAAARARLDRSSKALLVARVWATDPSAAPAEPARALLVLELSPASKAKHGSRAKPVLVAGTLRPAVATGLPPAGVTGPSILGPSLLSAQEVLSWFRSTGAQANTTVPIGALVEDYFRAARLTGVRADIAFAQSVVETGYFSFPVRGQDPASFNNFAGIGACDSCKHGWRFASAYLGVLTQETLLSEYAQPPPPSGPPGGLVAGLGVAGCCRTWMALSGVWASNPNYGYIILSIYKEIVDWVLTRQLQQTGLLPAWAMSPRLMRA